MGSPSGLLVLRCRRSLEGFKVGGDPVNFLRLTVPLPSLNVSNWICSFTKASSPSEQKILRNWEAFTWLSLVSFLALRKWRKTRRLENSWEEMGIYRTSAKKTKNYLRWWRADSVTMSTRVSIRTRVQNLTPHNQPAPCPAHCMWEQRQDCWGFQAASLGENHKPWVHWKTECLKEIIPTDTPHTYTHTYMETQIQAHTPHTHTDTLPHTHTCTHRITYRHTCHTHMHTHTCVFCICVSICVYVYVCACMCVIVCMCMCESSLFLHIHCPNPAGKSTINWNDVPLCAYWDFSTTAQCCYGNDGFLIKPG